MAQGIVKWFNGRTGCGVILCEDGSEVVVCCGGVPECYEILEEEQAVEFEVTEGPEGPQATNVRPI